MKKIRVYIYISILTIVCAANTCTCGRKSVNPTHYIDQTTRDYLIFLPNSKWVYQRENTTETDTNIVTSQNTIFSFSRALGRTSEIHGYSFSSSRTSAPCGGGGFSISNRGTNERSSCYAFFTNCYQSIVLFFNEPTLGYTSSEGLKYVAQYPNYTVQGKDYIDVREFAYTSALEPVSPKRIWYARYVGIIKKELANGEVWNLVEHDVKQ